MVKGFREKRDFYAEQYDSAIQERILEWVKMRGGRATAREAARNLDAIENSDAADLAMARLVAAGLGRWEDTPPGPRGGRPSRVFVVTEIGNPMNANSEEMKKVLVTPSMASEWLKTNTRNRRLSSAHVAHLEHVLRSGQWRINGDAIRFGRDGALQDGQHRLTACVNTGIGFHTFVVWNLESDAFDTIDVDVKPRSVSDIIGLHGVKNANGVSAAVKTLWAFKNTGSFYDGGYGSDGYTPRVCMELIQKRPNIYESVSKVIKNKQRYNAFSSKSLLGALHYLFNTVDERLSSEMIEVIENGSTVISRPFNLLRECLIKRRLTGVHMGRKFHASLSIKAWNSEISGKWIRRLQYTPSDPFPNIEGIDYEKLDEII